MIKDKKKKLYIIIIYVCPCMCYFMTVVIALKFQGSANNGFSDAKRQIIP